MTTATTKDSASNPPVTAASSPTREQAPSAIAAAAPEKPKRTLGLKIFDNFLYTVFTNFSVFAMSVGFTYMTKHGTTMGTEGSTTRSIGAWFNSRRKYIMKAFEKVGVTGQAAEDGTTVFFSFADGTLFAPLVKLIEDRREKIARKMDDALGTTPENLRAYEAEPKQSWRSVIEGRLLTSAIVLPVAITMEKTGGNKAIFYNYGDKLAHFVKTSAPKLDSWLSKKTIHEKNYFFQTGVFETFYTSVCTVGLYLISRGLARKHPKPEKEALPTTASNSGTAPVPLEATHETPQKETAEAKPTTQIASTTHLSRLAAPAKTAELTA